MEELKFFILILLVTFTYVLPLLAGSNQILDVGKFSASSVQDELPANWKSFAFKRIKKHTSYSLEKDNGNEQTPSVCGGELHSRVAIKYLYN